MDPTGAGRTRGFREPGADAPAAGDAAAAPEPSEAAEWLQSGPTPGRFRRLVRRRRTTATAGVLDRGPGVLRDRGRRATVPVGVLVVLLAVIAVLAFRLASGPVPPAARSAGTPAPTPAKPTPLPVTDLYARVVPSVVLITTSKGSLGSGVVVNDAGAVLTARHVVSGGGTLSILFADGTRAAATVTSADPRTDTATLTPQKLPEVVVAATLGGGVAVGADVVAIGNPLGLRDSTTTGVVSGTGRTTKTAAGSLSGLIQFDAAVNPGSSGGPLLDAQGLVVGVVVSIADPGHDDAFAGIGFAVPIGSALGGGAGEGQGGGPQL